MGVKPTPAFTAADGRSRASLEELLALRHQVPRLAASVHARIAPSGGHLSHLHARGVDYAESRSYQPGDDIRAMDWRVTARSGRPHTKLFREERERSLLVLLDTNPSMRFGTRVRFKSVQALRVAALAAWMAVRGGDRVGALAFGRVQAMAHPQGGTRGVLAVLGALMRWDESAGDGEESLSTALQRCLRVAPPGARVLLVSDGFSCDEAARALLLRLRRRAEVQALCVADALELAAPPAGNYSVENDGQRIALALTGAHSRHAFAEAMAQGRARLTALCERAHVPLEIIDTSAYPAHALVALLDPRRRH
jgi:uncharacterized protein (DUF58 family)